MYFLTYLYQLLKTFAQEVGKNALVNEILSIRGGLHSMERSKEKIKQERVPAAAVSLVGIVILGC